MLIFSRRPLEEVMIGDDIKITILDIKGNQIKVGISAPESIKVHRKEVYDRDKSKNR